MYCGDDVSSAVVDLGTYETRAGYSGEDCPRSVIPSVAGLLEDAKGAEDVEMKEDGKGDKRVYTGTAALNFKRDHMRIQPLYEADGILNFDILDDLLNHSIQKNLILQPKDTPLIFTENSVHNKEQRLKLTEFLFEKYRVPALFLCKDAVLSSFACGRSTAIILDSGNNQTTATPVHDGYALQKCILRHQVGGTTITDSLTDWLTRDQKLEIKPRFTFKRKFTNVEAQEVFETTAVEAPDVDPSYYKWSQEQIVNSLKEDHLYVAEEPLEGLGAAQAVRQQQFELPDGTQCSIGSHRVSITEQMFVQSETTEGFTGVQNMAVEAIGKTDIDIRRDLFQNIVLAGGNSCYKGFVERLQRQIPEIAPQNVKVKVIHSAERKFSPWIGGSILSSLGSFQQMWMSRQEFEEHGAIMIERKCP